MHVESSPGEALRDSSAKPSENQHDFPRTLESFPAAVYTCDAQGRITFYNQFAEHLWGRAPRLNDSSDRYCGSYKLYDRNGDVVPHEQCWMGRALHQNREFTGCEIIIERPDGQHRSVMANAYPIHSENGALAGGLSILVDVSERKRLEGDATTAEHAAAEHMKNERLAALMAEVRNALAPVRNAVQILYFQSGPFPDMRWSLDIMDRQVRQLTRVIDSVEQALATPQND
jgi:nitrogen-specific signal transduction histidine kinase